MTDRQSNEYKLRKFTTDDLKAEVHRRRLADLGPVVGYRAIYLGDEMNYGSYSDHLLKTYSGSWGYDTVEECLTSAKSGKASFVEPLYETTYRQKPGRIH